MVGLRPNEVSLTGMLSGCSKAGAIELGKILHGFIEKSGVNWITIVNNALVDMYARFGNEEMAGLVFQNMPYKSVVSWTSMIEGLAMHGHSEEAILFFMRWKDVELGQIRLPLFLSYMHVVMPEGLRLCIPMPISPNAIIWRTLLGACSIHGNVELAELAKARLFEIEPDNSSDNVLLSNIYAVAGKWKDVATMRRFMEDQKIKKVPGWSMIEVDRIMHRFVAGEQSNKATDQEAYKKLKEIMLRLRVEGGYVPEVATVLHDVDEEEKEDLLSKHSEKLAVAFGMSRLRKGKVIRVIEVAFTHLTMALVLVEITGDWSVGSIQPLEGIAYKENF
ncbi:Pentatricopeptide repeat-containing protein [Hibiscus syriacus]|uniref:Pentatricopeptide repeat-containing protein n=1 Tax=Hibiscus syriacus TaxID=106335 RepID=A0A6A2XAL9_HIBSY|nr:Pentatricopeptide repeat-containing protein [Hibiscus syriacus]